MNLTFVDWSPLAEVMEAYRPRLLSLIERRLTPGVTARVGADDILQDAFMRACSRWLEEGSGKAPTYQWLCGLVLDCLTEAYRHEFRQRRDLSHEQGWPEASSYQGRLGIVSPGTSPSSAANKSDLQDKLDVALAARTRDERHVIALRHEHALTFAEVAAELDTTVKNARVRYVRAVARLKAECKRRYPRVEIEL